MARAPLRDPVAKAGGIKRLALIDTYFSQNIPIGINENVYMKHIEHSILYERESLKRREIGEYCSKQNRWTSAPDKIKNYLQNFCESDNQLDRVVKFVFQRCGAPDDERKESTLRLEGYLTNDEKKRNFMKYFQSVSSLVDEHFKTCPIIGPPVPVVDDNYIQACIEAVQSYIPSNGIKG